MVIASIVKRATKNYRFGFDLWGLLLFIVIMLPNFVWFAFPAPNDILRAESVTESIDMIASICQVLMMAALCVIINKNSKKITVTPIIVSSIICCLLYYASWIFYYNGITNAIVILGLTIPPCLAFLFFALDRKNIPAVIPILIFAVCHLIYGIVNFII